MNKTLSVIILFLILIVTSYPQESSYYDAPFGGGIGFTPGWVFPQVYGINNELRNFGVSNLPRGGFLTTGGSGFIYLGMIKNFRIGGIGFGGARSSSSTIIKNNATPESPVPDYVSEYREAVYSLSGGGLTLEYTVPFIKNIGVSVGAIIGRGSLNIQLYKNLGSYDWQYFWAQADNSSSSTFSSTLKNNFWIFTPTLNVDIPAFHLLLFRLGAGYQFTFGDAWTYDNGKDIFNVPSNISGNCFFIQTGIFVGIFSF